MKDDNRTELIITTVTKNGVGESFFSERPVELNGKESRMLSDRIPALNFRLRSSSPEYSSDWHVAGDPTLLLILKGRILIELRTGEKKNFSEGEMFIAEDYLDGVEFDTLKHGHRAEVDGAKELQVLHLKLSERS